MLRNVSWIPSSLDVILLLFQTARFERLAAEMNEQFEEIESFELSIEAV